MNEPEKTARECAFERIMEIIKRCRYKQKQTDWKREKVEQTGIKRKIAKLISVAIISSSFPCQR